MTEKRKSATRWAIDLTSMLDKVFANDQQHRFPVNIAQLALDYSKQCFSSEPIEAIRAGEFAGNFEGVLTPIDDSKKSWVIIYNKKLSNGRANFTIAHEFGHYLLHRQDLQNGLQCNLAAMRDWGSDENNRENEANTFASYILMPFNDFREQIKGKAENLELFQGLSKRYGTSITATALRYLLQTPKRAVFILSIDGFIDWARSSESALKTGKFFAARKNTKEIPLDSLAAANTTDLIGAYKKTGGWFDNVGYTEMNLSIKDKNLTLLLLDDEDYPEEDENAVVIIRR